MRHPGQLVNSRIIGLRPESPGTAGRFCGSSNLGLIHLGSLVEHSGIRTQARVTQDSWSTPRDLGHGPESPGSSHRFRGT